MIFIILAFALSLVVGRPVYNLDETSTLQDLELNGLFFAGKG